MRSMCHSTKARQVSGCHFLATHRQPTCLRESEKATLGIKILEKRGRELTPRVEGTPENKVQTTKAEKQLPVFTRPQFIVTGLHVLSLATVGGREVGVQPCVGAVCQHLLQQCQRRVDEPRQEYLREAASALWELSPKQHLK